MVATYRVFAVRYAHLERTARFNFVGGDEHDAPMPLDYFVWAIVNDARTVIVDTGFDADAARRRGRELVRPVADGLGAIGIAPDQVEHIVISHMHYDHSGNHQLFPRARYHLQDAEMAYCTGRCMTEPEVGGVFDAGSVAAMVDKVFAGRVRFYDGDAELASGITLHKVGGHTRGMQIVRVATERGWVVLGSDTAHFYANLDPGRAFPIFDNGQQYVEAQRTALRLASSPDHYIPGHDPLVCARYPAARTGVEDIVRVDLSPRAEGAG
jgi:glyoxylase-like metal-dependent hydrolase (beta-lactamase superfamily II)